MGAVNVTLETKTSEACSRETWTGFRPPRSAYGRAINMSVHVGDKNLGGLPAQSPGRGAVDLRFIFVQTRLYLIVRRPDPHTDYTDFTEEHGKSKKSAEIRVHQRAVSQPIAHWLVGYLGNIGPRFARGGDKRVLTGFPPSLKRLETKCFCMGEHVFCRTGASHVQNSIGAHV